MPRDSQGNWIPSNTSVGSGSGNWWEGSMGHGNQGLPNFGANNSSDWDANAFGDAFGGGEYGQYGDSVFGQNTSGNIDSNRFSMFGGNPFGIDTSFLNTPQNNFDFSIKLIIGSL